MLKTEIANLALGRLGVSLAIADLDTDISIQTKVIKRHFRVSLETFLIKHDWSFARKEAALALLSTDNVRRQYTYEMPADALIIRQLAEDGMFVDLNLYQDQIIPWHELLTTTGTHLITPLPLAYAQYTANLDIDVNFPTHFARGLAAQIAWDIAPSLITNNFGKVADTLDAKCRIDMTSAIADDIARQPLIQDSPGPFLRARSY